MIIHYTKNFSAPDWLKSKGTILATTTGVAGALTGRAAAKKSAHKAAMKRGLKPGTPEYKKFIKKKVAIGTGIGAVAGAGIGTGVATGIQSSIQRKHGFTSKHSLKNAFNPSRLHLESDGPMTSSHIVNSMKMRFK